MNEEGGGVIDLIPQRVCLRLFPDGGHPSSFQPHPTGLMFSEQMGKGVTPWCKPYSSSLFSAIILFTVQSSVQLICV